MSPSDAQSGLKNFPSIDLGTGGPDAHLAQPDLKLEGPNETLDSITAAHDMADAAHFGDFQFPYQNPLEDSPMSGLPHTFDDHGPDVFTTPQAHSISPMQDRQDSVASITVQTSGYGGVNGQRPTPDGSSNGTPDSNANGASLLDEPMSDEFGLATGPADGTDLGGKKGEKSDATPAWSELKTKAGKERKRLPLACIACRRKKIRCSGEKPACKHCLRSRIPCVYKVTARKAAPRTDYMAMLDKRLKRMEERIIKVVPKAEQDAMSSAVTRAVVKPAIPGTLPGGKTAAKKRGVDEAFGPDLDHWARAPSRSKLDGPNKPSTILVQEAEESKLLLEGGDALPSKELQEHLAEVFFENIYGQAYHILHKPSFMRKLKAGTLPPVLVLSVCAIAARFSNHPKLNTNPNFLRGEEWASAARDILTKRYEWPNITILTCLLILGLHEFGTCHGGRSWSLGGQAIRMAFALQLHKDLEHDPLRIPGKTQLSFIDREIRRRTMWACFLMDRFNSSGTDRPTFVREETLKIPLPIKEKNFQYDLPGPTETLSGQVLEPLSDDRPNEAKDNMGVAAWMIKAIALWGRIINYLNQGKKELDPHPMWSPDSGYTELLKQTEDFLTELPACLAYTPENLKLHETDNMANQFLFLHISIQQNILFMNRFAVSSPSGHSLQDVPKAFVTKAGAKAFAAANRVSELLKDAEAHFITAPFTGYCAFLSSTVHIFGIFSGNPAMEATSKRNLATNVRFLSKMKRYWGMFHWMSENLREQYRTCADAARQGNPASESAASPIFQYGDWFDRYPHGVSQSDFLDPATYKKKETGADAVLEQKPELHTVEEFFTTLSPQSAENAAANGGARSGPPNAAQLKRKSVVRKASTTSRGGGSGPEHGLEPLQTDFARATAEQLHAARLHQRSFSGAGAPTSGAPPGSFNPLAVAGNGPGPYHPALSPVSPVTFSHHHHHAPPQSFFAPDPFSMPLAATHGMSRLDRQLVFGAYGGQSHAVDHPSLSGSLAGWADSNNASEGGGRDGHGHGHGHGGHGRHHGHGGHPHQHPHQHPADAALHAAFGEPSSAWFMPFNMEPPELGPEGLGVAGGMGGLEGFANMFGGGAGGGGGMHHR
ncbi:fungal-specific transcription factor domain-containing protein [Chaetomidium leptoderma]|uniref:Fungal-specific transcription factor domain-containing protein n=1 Tax=Chaetomidium leptoderma TaxID=669021 RepID=A0AAN6VSH6_9PEZI|nr:fungal-specific transcription factor domain-containing protein [Chaetomidium leptoderma]